MGGFLFPSDAVISPVRSGVERIGSVAAQRIDPTMVGVFADRHKMGVEMGKRK